MNKNEIKKLAEHSKRLIETHASSYLRAIEKAQSIHKAIKPMVSVLAAMQSQWNTIIKSAFITYEPLFQDLQKSIQGLIPKIQTFSLPIIKAINSIPKDMFIKLNLSSSYFIITDDEDLITGIKNLKENESAENFVISYHSRNQWEKAESLFKNWKKTSCDPKRIEILRDCIQSLKVLDDSGLNPSNIVIPALISQIDGLMAWFYENLPEKIKEKIKKREKEEKDQIKKNEIKKSDILVEESEEFVGFKNAYLLNSVILDGLFATGHEIKNGVKKSLNEDYQFELFRHKIQHGDKNFLGYGKKENIVRLILYIDFLIKLTERLKKKNKSDNTSAK